MICPDCAGNGMTFSDGLGWQGREVWRPCAECQGTGEVAGRCPECGDFVSACDCVDVSEVDAACAE